MMASQRQSFRGSPLLTADFLLRSSRLVDDLRRDGGPRPRSWEHTLVTLLPKKTHPDHPSHYRPISLLNQAQKIYEKVVADEMAPKIVPNLTRTQFGFCRGRQASEPIQIVKRIQELSVLWNGSYVLAKVDLSWAFDRISQVGLQSLLAAGVGAKWVLATARELLRAKAYPYMRNAPMGRRVELKRGIRQGSPLSGLLFVSALSWGLRDVFQSWDDAKLGLCLEAVIINVLLYADDMIVAARNPWEL